LAPCALFFGAHSASPRSKAQETALQGGPEKVQEETPAQAELRFGPDQAWLAIPVQLEVTHDYLEFLLVNPHGAVHESLLSTEVDAQVLNTAFLAMGLEPGSNARWEARGSDPLDPSTLGVQGPRPGGAAAPARDQYQVIPPTGDGLYLHLAWREGDEWFFYRLEDLVRDLDRARTLRRHKFVYLGSYMTEEVRSGTPRFAASLEGNLINAAFFKNGATLLTTAVEECDKQSNWLANAWLLPDRGSSMQLVFAKQPLLQMPSELASSLVTLPALQAEPTEERAR